jgi:hypothetical protein
MRRRVIPPLTGCEGLMGRKRKSACKCVSAVGEFNSESSIGRQGL